jgi:hypothetical protein
MTTKLATIADEMKTLVGQEPTWAQRSLPAGLRIIYQRHEDGRVRLALAREDAYPSDDDIASALAAFTIPASAEADYGQHRWISPKTNRPVNFYRVQFQWMER